MSSSGLLCMSRASQYKKLGGEGNVLLSHNICRYHASLGAMRGLCGAVRGGVRPRNGINMSLILPNTIPCLHSSIPYKIATRCLAYTL